MRKIVVEDCDAENGDAIEALPESGAELTVTLPDKGGVLVRNCGGGSVLIVSQDRASVDRTQEEG